MKITAFLTAVLLSLTLICACSAQTADDDLPTAAAAQTDGAGEPEAAPTVPGMPADDNLPTEPGATEKSLEAGVMPSSAPTSAPIAISAEAMDGLCAVLTGIAQAALSTGSSYCRDAEFASAYIRSIANEFYYARAQACANIQDTSYGEYMLLSGEEITYLMNAAFGADAPMPAADGDMIIENSGNYYIALCDQEYSVSLAYSAKSDPLFDPSQTYDFVCTYQKTGEEAANTTVSAVFRDAAGGNPLGLCVADFSIK